MPEKRYIDAENLIEHLEKSIIWCKENLCDSTASYELGCIATIKDAISSVKMFISDEDVVPVVRCKYCEYWVQGEAGGYCDNPDGLNLNTDLKENDYCSYGERKDEK